MRYMGQMRTFADVRTGESIGLDGRQLRQRGEREERGERGGKGGKGGSRRSGEPGH